MTARVVVRAGADEPVPPLPGDAQVVALDWVSRRRNVQLDLERLSTLLPRPLNDSALDLLEVTAALVMGDHLVQRGANEQWVRALAFAIPVRQPNVWEAAAPALVSLFHLMTGDNASLEFRAKPDGPAAASGNEGRQSGADCVSLLSGGIDSFGGAVAALEERRRPLFVMHRSANAMTLAAQRRVVRSLRVRYGDTQEFVRVPLGVSRVSAPDWALPTEGEREPSRRARSLWYLALAAVAAWSARVEEVLVPENGIMALHVPMGPSRVGGFSTRTTHPEVLARFESLASGILGWRLSIRNPLLGYTKAEVVRDILRWRVSEAEIRGTESCWQAGRHPRPCGACVPCLQRQLAFATAGVGQEVQQIDLLSDPESHRGTEGFRNLADLLGMVSELARLPDDELLSRHPALAQPGLKLEAAIGLYRRFAGEVGELGRTRYPALRQMTDGRWQMTDGR